MRKIKKGKRTPKKSPSTATSLSRGRSKLSRQQALPEKDLEQFKENLEKTGEAIGDLFKGLFKGMVKILDVVGEMEEKGEEIRTYRKEIRGVTKSGKEFRGETGWKIGFLDALSRRKKKLKKTDNDFYPSQ